jgi:hypothetical protein
MYVIARRLVRRTTKHAAYYRGLICFRYQIGLTASMFRAQILALAAREVRSNPSSRHSGVLTTWCCYFQATATLSLSVHLTEMPQAFAQVGPVVLQFTPLVRFSPTVVLWALEPDSSFSLNSSASATKTTSIPPYLLNDDTSVDSIISRITD